MSDGGEIQDIKVRFSEFSLPILHDWVSSGMVEEELALKLMSRAEKLIENYLICGGCKRLLPDEEFYKQRVQYARRSRSHNCKSCWNEAYGKEKKK